MVNVVAVGGLGHMGGPMAANPVKAVHRVRDRAEVVVSLGVLAVLDILDLRVMSEVVAATDQKESMSAFDDKRRTRFIHR
ncbi:hypothetical protein [Streptomyces fagopyri]|uniref:hypothetical protein n=1 Tax=Streptomyces fagopyri TaxID=2662397 RepID=UPI0037246558